MQEYSRWWKPKKGIEEQKIIYFHYQDLHTAVSVLNKFKVSETDKNLKLHAAIINKFTKKCAVIPFPINTVVGERFGKGILKRYYFELKKILNNIADAVEIKLFVTRTDSSQQIDFSPQFEKKLRSKSVAFRRRPINSNPEAIEKITDIKNKVLANQIHLSLEEISKQTQTEIVKNEKILLQGNYLIAKQKLFDFQTNVEHMQRIYPNLTFDMIGPVHPFDFVPINIMENNIIQ